MARIRSDLAGTVYVHMSSGSVVLRAGDEVPTGAVVSPDLVEMEVEASGKTGGRTRSAKRRS